MIYSEDEYKSCSTCRHWKRYSEDDHDGYEYGYCSELGNSIMVDIEVEGLGVNNVKTECSFCCSLHD